MAPAHLLLTVAVDASGSVATDRFSAITAVCGNPDVWAVFCDAWNSVLEKYGIAHFHAVEAFNFSGEFEGKSRFWDDPAITRDNLLMELMGVIVRHDFVCHSIWIDHLKVPSKRLPKAKVNQFRMLLRQLLHQVPDDFTLHLLVDEDQEAAMDYYRLFHRFKNEVPQFRDRLAGICFFSDTDVPHIQCADFLAYLGREDAERITLRPHQPRHPALTMLYQAEPRLINFGRPSVMESVDDEDDDVQ
jgi:hypothetical protein